MELYPGGREGKVFLGCADSDSAPRTSQPSSRRRVRWRGRGCYGGAAECCIQKLQIWLWSGAGVTLLVLLKLLQGSEVKPIGVALAVDLGHQVSVIVVSDGEEISVSINRFTFLS